MKKSILGILISATALITLSGHAVPINGTIAFSGTASASTGGGVTTVAPASPWSVVYGLGDYFPILPLTPATFAPISYTGTGSGASLTAALTPLWELPSGGPIIASFDLLTLTTATTVIGAGPGLLSSVAMTGTGVAHLAGFDDTVANWSLSGTGPTATLIFSFSTTTATGTGVPDGATTLALMGFGLMGLAAVRRQFAR